MPIRTEDRVSSVYYVTCDACGHHLGQGEFTANGQAFGTTDAALSCARSEDWLDFGRVIVCNECAHKSLRPAPTKRRKPHA